MAENTLRENTSSEKKSKKKIGTSFKLPSFQIKFLKDRRFIFISGLALLGLAFFCLVSFISYMVTGAEDQSVVEAIGETGLYESGQHSANYFGGVGAWIAHVFIYEWFGIASFLFVPIFFLIGYKIVFKVALIDLKSNLRTLSFSILWISVLIATLIETMGISPRYSYLGGGAGFEAAKLLDSLMGWGSIIVLAFLLMVFIVYNFNFIDGFSPDESDETDVKSEEEDEALISEEEPDDTSSLETNEPESEEDRILDPNGDHISLEIRDEDTNESETQSETEVIETPEESKREEIVTENVELSTSSEELNVESSKEEVRNTLKNASLELTVETPIEVPVENTFKSEGPEALEMEVVDEPVKEEVVDSNFPVSEEIETNLYDPTLDLSHFKLPPLELLKDYGQNKVSVTKEELEANKDKIVNTLGNYKIGIASIKATIGPTVTLYEIVPDAGVRISKIINLENDIALSLAALGIRIIAPIPGKGTIGIEVPNKKPEMVSMHSVVGSERFADVDKMDLPIVLGKTISNEVFVTDLAKMPHLLMAGATGQGKSVGLNAILASLLYKKHPSQLKFVMVDPKKVELSIYNKIEKHYLAMLPDSDEPIITDTSKVVNTLNSLCIEMDNRYELLKNGGCRNLKEYNQKFVERKLNPQNGHRFMPYIVLIIDELADLMMTAGKEVETPIARLAQLARAIGIHLIVATQRPSVNVITGIIKANFPARLSFRVTSKIDSRTILDTGGADQLIGKGDMLLSIGSDIVRIQCAFVDTPECDRICDYIEGQQGYSTAYQLPEYVGEDAGGNSDVDLEDRDQFFEDAARLIVRNQQGSTSLIQRKMKLGYNRAGRIMDQLEAAGIVGPSQGSKAREVLMPDEYSLEQLLTSLNSGDM